METITDLRRDITDLLASLTDADARDMYAEEWREIERKRARARRRDAMLAHKRQRQIKEAV